VNEKRGARIRAALRASSADGSPRVTNAMLTRISGRLSMMASCSAIHASASGMGAKIGCMMLRTMRSRTAAGLGSFKACASTRSADVTPGSASRR
jgi:hypothetical protein